MSDKTLKFEKENEDLRGFEVSLTTLVMSSSFCLISSKSAMLLSIKHVAFIFVVFD